MLLSDSLQDDYKSRITAATQFQENWDSTLTSSEQETDTASS